MSKSEKIIDEINILYHYFRYSRSFFPYLNTDLVGETASPLFNISKSLKASVSFTEPITDEFLLLNNQIGHFLNQNFLIRLYALLDYHQIVSDQQKINKEFPGSDEVDILRRLRRLFSHTSGKYNPTNSEQKILVQRMIDHFRLQITAPEDFPISIDTVISPLVLKIKEYIRAKLEE